MPAVNTTGTVPTPKHRLAVLDGLRILAALYVASFHFIGSNSLDHRHHPAYYFPNLHPIAAYGFLGVELFFLISGFVIGMSSWGRGVGDFVTSRVVRLYPAYWLAVLVTAVVLLCWQLEAAPMQPNEVLLNLTMLHDPFGVRSASPAFWTLWVELRFYLLFVLFVVWRGCTYRRVVIFCAVWVTASVFAPAIKSPAYSQFVIPEYAPYFAAGITMYLMHRYRPNLVLWGIVGACWLLSQHNVITRLNDMSAPAGGQLHWWVGGLLVTAFYAVMLAVALGAFARIQWRWLTVAGALTYPFYLLHHQIGLTMFRAVQGHLPNWMIVVAVTTILLGVSWLVHRFVERPLAPIMKRAMRRAISEMRGEVVERAPVQRAVGSGSPGSVSAGSVSAGSVAPGAVSSSGEPVGVPGR
jgi:peptidoglycan/LPS O-acetylase OafA/YrhL